MLLKENVTILNLRVLLVEIMETLTRRKVSQSSDRVCNFVLDDLKKRLPDYVSYHNLAHTMDVIECCKKYLNIYELTPLQEDLLIIAAASHDYGFVVSPDSHEATSAKMMSKIMKTHGYSSRSIRIVKGMIMATKLPQSPATKLENIIADADLDYLGRTDYDEISDRLYQELKHFKKIQTLRQWLELQISFLENHTYHTQWAIENREPAKQKRIKSIKRKLEKHLASQD